MFNIIVLNIDNIEMARELKTTSRNMHNDPTRQRLINVAGTLFAERGFSSTSVREITHQAQCNLASVNYYFHSKENLYFEIFQSELTRLREQRIEAIQEFLQREPENDALEKLLYSFAAAFLAPLIDRQSGPRLMQLITREMLEPHLPEDMFIREVIVPVNQVLLDTLMRICPGLDQSHAQQCVFSVVGQLMFAAHHLNNQAILVKSKIPAADIDTLITHIVKFSASGVRNYLV